MAPSLHTGPQAPGHKDDSGALVSASVLRGGYLNPLILGFLSIALQTYHSLLLGLLLLVERSHSVWVCSFIGSLGHSFIQQIIYYPVLAVNQVLELQQ